MLAMAVSPDSHASLSRDIENVRNQMIQLGCRFGFLHPEVQQCSKQLDQLLLQYYEMDRLVKNG